MYLAHTRPNLIYALGTIIQFMQNPKEQYMMHLYAFLWCSKFALGKEILFTKNIKV